VAEIMKAHGGSARVDAAPGRGAVFTLVFCTMVLAIAIRLRSAASA